MSDAMSDDTIAKQGIDAYLAGDEENARRLLIQAVEQNPKNADAWYYLSRIYSSPEKIRHCLERALKANPDHERAKRALRELDPVMIEEDAFNEAHDTEDDSASTEPTRQTPPDTPPNRVEFPQSPFSRSAPRSKPNTGDSPETRKNPFAGGSPFSSNEPRSSRPDPERPSTMSYRYKMPSGIPGAPDKLSLEEYWNFLRDAIQTGFQALITQDTRIDTVKASWWNIWLIVFSIGLISGITTLVLLMFINARALNVLSIASIPLLFTVRTLIGFGAASYITHWYMTTQAKVPATFLDHSYTLVMLWAPASLINLGLFVVAFVLQGSIITFPVFVGGGFFNANFMTILMTAAAIGLVGWTMYRMRQALQQLYGYIIDPRPYWIAAAVMLIVLSVV